MLYENLFLQNAQKEYVLCIKKPGHYFSVNSTLHVPENHSVKTISAEMTFQIGWRR